MRIISKFKDYYDSAASFGIDKDWVYDRATVTVPIKFDRNQYTKSPVYPFPALSTESSNDYHAIWFKPQVLGFAGKLYPLVEVSTSSESKFYYSAEELISEYGQYFKSRSWRFKDNSFSMSSQEDIQAFFNYSFPELTNFFTTYKTPIFIYRNTQNKHSSELEVELNTSLKAVDFFKIKDAPTTFQEIFMFLSGVLGKVEKDIVQISNQDKVNQHGFDKWSFRKMPSLIKD